MSISIAFWNIDEIHYLVISLDKKVQPKDKSNTRSVDVVAVRKPFQNLIKRISQIRKIASKAIVCGSFFSSKYIVKITQERLRTFFVSVKFATVNSISVMKI